MNAEQIYEIAKRIEQLRGSNAIVTFRTGNNTLPYLSIHVTGTGYRVSDVCNCKRIESCIQIIDFNTCIKVLDKIIQQAKSN